MTSLLPHMDQQALYDQVDPTLSWNDPRHRRVFTTFVPAFHSGDAVRHSRDGYGIATYASNQLVIGPGVGLRLHDIADGQSETILVGDVKERLKPWGHPLGYRDVGLGVNQSAEGFGGWSKSGAYFLMADGQVRSLRDTIDPQVLKALATPAGGETVSDD
jgi:hypothetical protein